jgi:hypothetical protein
MPEPTRKCNSCDKEVNLDSDNKGGTDCKFCTKKYMKTNNIDSDEEELDHEDEDDIFERMPSNGYDMNLSKLVRLLNGLRNEFSLSILRLAVAIRRAIMSLEDKSWDILVQNENVALNIYVFLHHLDVALDPSVEDSVIFVEYLLDDLDERLQLKNEWQDVVIAV